MYNTNNFPPNINPHLYAILAVAVGAAIVDDFSVIEQSSIGNWLMLVSQYIITHAAQQNLIENRSKEVDINSSNQNSKNEIEYLLEAVRKIYEELEKLKNEG